QHLVIELDHHALFALPLGLVIMHRLLLRATDECLGSAIVWLHGARNLGAFRYRHTITLLSLCIHSADDGLHLIASLRVARGVFYHAAPSAGGVRECFAASYLLVEQLQAIDLADHLGGFLVVMTLWVGGVEHDQGAQGVVDLAGLAHQLGNLPYCPDIEAAGLHRNQYSICHS